MTRNGTLEERKKRRVRREQIMGRLHALLVWALWGVVVALVAVIALGLVANVL